jgi:hypothetical protein
MTYWLKAGFGARPSLKLSSFARRILRVRFILLLFLEHEGLILHIPDEKIMEEEEEILNAWVVISLNKAGKEQERVFVVTSKAVYRVKYDYGNSKKPIERFKKLPLAEINSIDRGPQCCLSLSQVAILPYPCYQECLTLKSNVLALS